jgi:hypothetical protein
LINRRTAQEPIRAVTPAETSRSNHLRGRAAGTPGEQLSLWAAPSKKTSYVGIRTRIDADESRLRPMGLTRHFKRGCGKRGEPWRPGLSSEGFGRSKHDLSAIWRSSISLDLSSAQRLDNAERLRRYCYFMGRSIRIQLKCLSANFRARPKTDRLSSPTRLEKSSVIVHLS